MATRGFEGTSRVLIQGRSGSASLGRALAALAAERTLDHTVGIAAGLPREEWVGAIQNVEGWDGSSTLLDTLGDEEPPGGTAPGGIDVRDLSGASLGDVGVAAVNAIAGSGASRPAVVIDSVAALTDDPGTRFKFLALLGRRVALDDGVLLALEGAELPDHERHTFAEVFDDIRDEEHL